MAIPLKKRTPLYQKPLTTCNSSTRFWWLYGALPESHGDVDVHSSAGNYGYREFLSVVAMSNPEDALSGWGHRSFSLGLQLTATYAQVFAQL